MKTIQHNAYKHRRYCVFYHGRLITTSKHPFPPECGENKMEIIVADLTPGKDTTVNIGKYAVQLSAVAPDLVEPDIEMEARSNA